jgi:DNA repair photolyase
MFVRWESQTIEHQEAARGGQVSLPGIQDAVIRHFDAPEALDMRFHEIRTKSALNRVPGTRLPFNWTVNPYRGCSHACAYCVGGDTPVLMADGSRRAIAELDSGDRIVGTVGGRFAETDVRARWATVKPAYLVLLADGTELVASGDHRFLTPGGWRHVKCGGGEDRPHLRIGSRLLGTGAGRAAVARRRSGSVATREPDVTGGRLATADGLAVVAIEPIGRMELYDITTGTGDFLADGVVSHNCFARPTHEYLDMDAGRDFEREIVVKVNVPEVLRAELARPSWRGEHVALGTNTDPYQWVEGRYRLMRGIWEVLRDAANPCSILTKSPLVLRDLDLLLEIAERTEVSACLSVPTLDEKAWRATEPHTPHPKARLEAVAELNRAGIPTGILIAPLMPGINDAPEQVERIVELATEAGAVHIGGQTLFLRGSVRDVFFGFLRQHRPDLVTRYERLYAKSAYLPDAQRRSIELAAGAPWARRAYADRFRHRPPALDPPKREESRQQALF